MNERKPDINLLIAALICLVCGLQAMAVSARYYFTNKDVPLAQIDPNNKFSLLVLGQEQIIHKLVYQVVPLSGAALLVVGFLIWNYLRKMKQEAEENRN